MQTNKPEAIRQKILPLFLSLAMLVGVLPLSSLGSKLVQDAEARGVARGPGGGAVVAGPRGAAGVGPRGGTVVASPRGYVHGGSSTVVTGPRRTYVEGPRGGQAYVGPRGGAYRGPYGGGAIVRTLPPGARAVAIAGATYYVASGVYYRPTYEGSTVVYQQVENPEEQ